MSVFNYSAIWPVEHKINNTLQLNCFVNTIRKKELSKQLKDLQVKPPLAIHVAQNQHYTTENERLLLSFMGVVMFYANGLGMTIHSLADD